MKKLIFDSNVFDKFVSGEISITAMLNANCELYLTHIQLDELNECSDNDKRARLFLVVAKLRPIIIPTESFVVGVSRIGEAKITDGNDLIAKLRKDNPKHTNDATIGEVAIKNELTLVTQDITFKKRVIELGGQAVSLDELLSHHKNG